MGTVRNASKEDMRRRRRRRIKRRKVVVLGSIWCLIISFTVLAVVILFHTFMMKKQSDIDNSNSSGYETISKEELNKFKSIHMSDGDEGKKNEYTVCLDAGHGGNDVGAERENSIYEKVETLRLTGLLKQYLEALGIKVVMTRNSDKYVSLEERRNIAEECDADLLLSIHRNVYEGTQEVNGIEAWINNEQKSSDIDMAEKIIEGVLTYIPSMNNRGVKWGTMDNPYENYAVNKSSMTSLILEVGFMTSDTDNYYFDNNIEDIAKGIAEGIFSEIIKG